MKLLVYIEPTRYILDLWRELRARGDADATIVFTHENRSQAWNLDLSNVPGCIALHGSRLARIRTLASLVMDRRVSLVHLAGWSGPLMKAALAFARVRGLPVTVESDTQATPQPRWKRALKGAVYPLLFAFIARFLPAGSRQAAYLRSYGVGQERIRVAQMTVDVEGIASATTILRRSGVEALRAAWDVAPGATVFLFVGRLEPDKGLDALLAAFAQLGAGSALVIVGEGSLDALVSAAARRDPRIRAVGRRAGEELLALYALADVLVLPSTVEPWGLVVNEALAAGLPVIVSDAVGAVDDLVHGAGSGIVTAAGNVADLRAAMEAMSANAAQRRGMAERARAVISGWTLAHEAEIILNTWKELEEH